MTTLSALKEACEAATPKPWSVDLCKAEDCWHIKYGTRGHWLATVPIDGDEESSERDAAFIAMSRTAVPELIARVEAAEALLRRIVEIENDNGMGVIGWSEAMDDAEAHLSAYGGEPCDHRYVDIGSHGRALYECAVCGRGPEEDERL